MFGRRSVLTTCICLVVLLLREVSQSLESSSSERAPPVTVAVDVDGKRPWWSHWLLGELSDHHLSARADQLAAEFNLVNRGTPLGFKTLFKFEVPSETRERRSSEGPSNDDNIEDALRRHRYVRWASIQHPLKRVKRGFNDPRFKAQWHLVC